MNQGRGVCGGKRQTPRLELWGGMARSVSLVALLTTACPTPPPSSPPSSAPLEHRRFLRIRELLGQNTQSTERSVQLAPLVDPICRKAEARAAFRRSISWSVSHSTESATLPTQLALDVLEYVATACARVDPDVAMQLLASAADFMEYDHGRLDVLRARIAAATEHLREAEAAALRARERGSVHAIALLANIQARRARNQRTLGGLNPEDLDPAIETVMVEPGPKWTAIDLTAVLSTRARLLNEKALWAGSEARSEVLAQAHEVFRRLSVAPFVEAVRRGAVDALCFDEASRSGEPPAVAEAACARAALEHGIAGAAVRLNLLSEDLPAKVDRKRLGSLLQTGRFVARELEPQDAVLVVFRGDEVELVEWARPAARLLEALAANGVSLMVVDRCANRRASAVVERIVELAKVTPKATLRLGPDPLAMPCLVALAAGRRITADCSLSAEQIRSLARLRRAPRLNVLVGRDLDAEIQDFGLYELPVVLLSFRESGHPELVETWAKSLSDVWALVRDP
ncbi:MAG: hypothetical protein ACFB9M_08085 [Myxococcota bacterium]